MAIGGISLGQTPYSNSGYGAYGAYGANGADDTKDTDATGLGTSKAGSTEDDEEKSPAEERAAKRAGTEECETCAKRKYQDGSDENVSFKSAAHVSPTAAGAAVRGHEQEHVSNAYDKAKQNDGKVLQASVTIHTAVCPECGRTYVSGGETTTQILYKNEDNPYQQARKSEDAGKYTGMNINLVG